MRTLIKNGTVYFESGHEVCDVLVEDSKIARIGESPVSDEFDEIIDATGLSVLPGFIDMHVHLDEQIGKCTLADDFRTGSQIALLNGITTLVGFITQRENKSLKQAVEKVVKRASEKCLCNFAFHLTPTKFSDENWNEIRELVESGFKTFKFYTTYKEAGIFSSYEQLREIMKRLALLDCTVLVHCEDETILEKYRIEKYDFANAFNHSLSKPEKAEIVAIERVIKLAQETGCRVHIVHVSTAEGVKLIMNACRRIPITCETAPQYLFLNSNYLLGEAGYRYVCSPPLRSEKTQEQLKELAIDGAFDIFATDHCAFLKKDKDEFAKDFRKVPNGIAGLGALVPLMYELLVKEHKLDFGELVKRLSLNPAMITGLYPQKGTIKSGSDADIVILDTNSLMHPIVSSSADVYESYPGKTTTLDFRYVYLQGELVIKDNKLASHFS